jgi:hypothetical protein
MPTGAPYAGRIAPLLTWTLLAGLGAWLLHPILTPVHVEGFSASIVSLALHLDTRQLADFDRLHPANLEYFTLSRLGSVTFVAFLTQELLLSGDKALCITTWLGFVALTWSSFVLTRRWAQASNIVAAFALLSLPGLAESAFFYNDTIFAAGLGVTALAVVSASPSRVAAATAGLLFGAAIVSRLDAVLLAPAVVLVGYGQHGLGKPFWIRALIFTIGVLLPIVLVPAVLDATILDVYATTRRAVVLWGDGLRLAQHAREFSFFIGMPAALLTAMGYLALVRKRESLRLILLGGVPVLFNLVALGKVWQSRQLLPLTPFFAALMIIGWRHVLAEARERGATTLMWTVAIVCCVAWLAPTVVVRVSDGPRAPYGRLWSPVLWTRWQGAVKANQVEIRTLVKHLPAPSTAIITDSWDGDRYLHLALQEEGFRRAGDAAAADACGRTAEVFEKERLRLLHVRLHQPFLPNWRQLAATRLETWGIPCLQRWKPIKVMRLTPPEQLLWSVSDSASSAVLASGQRAMAVITHSGYSPQVAIEVDPADLQALRRGYDLAADRSEALLYGRRLPAMSLSESERLMAARVWLQPPFSESILHQPRAR